MRIIDADKLLSDVSESLYHNNHTGEGRVYHRQEHAHFAHMIEMQPTIEAVPVKRGKWVEVRRHRDADGCILTDYKCSECGIMLRDTIPDDKDSEFYCYHCGADMREE